MTEEQVRKALPKYNYFYRDRGYAVVVKPPWSWDQVGPLSYLICTYGKAKDKSGNIRGGDIVTGVEVVDFAEIAEPAGGGMFRVDGVKSKVSREVWECICLIHQSPAMNPNGFDPTALVRAVNGLRAHGKTAAIEALTCYRNMAMDFEGGNRSRFNLDEERIYNICSLLFEPSKAGLAMPRYPGPAGRPLMLESDLPFYLMEASFQMGPSPDPLSLIQFCEQNCRLRARELQPSGSPVLAADKVCASESLRGRNTQFVREQALRCLRLPEYQEVPFRKSFDFKICPNCVGEQSADRFWKEYTEPLRERRVRWDGAARGW